MKAYDVDEDYGETDYVYLNDDIYLPMDQTNQSGKNYNKETIGYLSGTDNTWNTTILEIPDVYKRQFSLLTEDFPVTMFLPMQSKIMLIF